MKDRIADRFNKASEEGRACFVSYVCAGDPDLDTSLDICKALIDGGIDVLELGVPFSDPLADGIVNQLASQRALDSGVKHSDVFDLVRKIRKFSELPIVFYTYYNLVYSMGLQSYVEEAVDAGVDGILVLDCPPEEMGDLEKASTEKGLKNICIVAPTTPTGRLSTVTAKASGFIYYVSRMGVTGERNELAADIGDAVTEIKKHTKLPVVVGFGVSTADHVSQIAKVADGVVVGSSIVKVIADHENDREKAAAAVKDKLSEMLVGL